MLIKKPSTEVTPPSIEPTVTPHVYRVVSTGQFVFADETGDLDNGLYESEQDAARALRRYSLSLDGPTEAVNVLKHTTAGVLLLNAMVRHNQQTGADLIETFEPVDGVVEAQLRINGHIVPLVEALDEVWQRLSARSDEIAPSKALKMIDEAGVEPIISMLQNVREQTRTKLLDKFPDVHVSDDDRY